MQYGVLIDMYAMSDITQLAKGSASRTFYCCSCHCYPLKCRGCVVVQNGVLIDMYARSDITQLAKGNAYNRLQWEEVTVGQALALAQIAAPHWPAQPPGPGAAVRHPLVIPLRMRYGPQ